MTCNLHDGPRVAVRPTLAALALAATCSGAAAQPAPQYFPPVAHPPLDPPLSLTGSFGEYRPGHFHAGLDLSVGGVVGAPVYASLAGRVVRVRASGAGYGRSVYLEADDGRLLVYAHLDAFEPGLAAWVAAAQDSGGRYEQDLWPPRDRFRFEPGAILGWAGRSGTGPPHLHFEIRRGDVAYNPLLAGVSIDDRVAPTLLGVSLVDLAEPPGVYASVRRDSGGPWRTVAGTPASDTLVAPARFRVVVEAGDARANGRLTMAPWRVTARWDSGHAECRFDSVSWAEGMTEVDYVYDRGRVPASNDRLGLRLWAPESFVPRVTGGGFDSLGRLGYVDFRGREDAGWLEVSAEDANGNVVRRRLRLDAQPVVAAFASWPAHEPYAAAETVLVDPTDSTEARVLSGGIVWRVPRDGAFEPRRVVLGRIASPARTGELTPAGGAAVLEPMGEALRRPAWLGVRPRGRASAKVGLYRGSGGEWEWIGNERDAAGAIGGATRRLGRFALFEDSHAPRLLRTTVRPDTAGRAPYSRWALEWTLDERGSGVSARDSWAEVDGRRVPVEWDAEWGVLRWRPLEPPSRGRHAWRIAVADRAGNVRRGSGTFGVR